MIKKILVTAAAGAIALTMTASAFAAPHAGATITKITSTSNSGYNQIVGGTYKSSTTDNYISGGNSASKVFVVNGSKHNVTVTTVTSNSNSGNNQIVGGGAKSTTNGNEIDSGNSSSTVVVVNSSISAE